MREEYDPGLTKYPGHECTLSLSSIFHEEHACLVLSPACSMESLMLSSRPPTYSAVLGFVPFPPTATDVVLAMIDQYLKSMSVSNKPDARPAFTCPPCVLSAAGVSNYGKMS